MKDSIEYRKILFGLGYVKCFQGNFFDAESIYLELWSLTKSDEDHKEESIVIHQLATLYWMAKDYEKAWDWIKKEEGLLCNFLQDNHLGFSANLYEQGMLFFLENNYFQAEKIMLKALIYADKTQDLICQGCAYRGLGEIYIAMNKKISINNLKLSKEKFKLAGELIAVNEVEEI